ncbi:glycoside hydrolase family 172 protein [Prevotella sp. 10(H)]|uniref:glycoside hydrolase family 172 protein n=1 Tax=Prevotella sp. 10(H) TaxID=1158294 RepID=UPI0009DEC0DB|nr:glycoside hydrolase family 172 protein [Prevotella sp. 10(H)]
MKLFAKYSMPAILILLLAASCAKNYPPVTMGTLLDEMVNREALAQYPDPYFECKQFSSYDRATVDPGDKSWFANWDRSMFIRIDSLNGKKEYVLMDTKGPGAIVRFWMTFAGENSGKGIMRIYLDNDSVPVIEGSAFDVISNGLLVGAPLSASVSDSTKYEMRGHNLYLPIPYARHCKVTYESENIKDAGAKTGGEAVYYNINYRTYAKKVVVHTYSLQDLTTYQPEIIKVQQKLQSKDAMFPENIVTDNLNGNIAAGKSIEKIITNKSSAIRGLKFKLEADKLEQALRSTILEISFDGNTTVKCPIGDFFGTGYQIRKSSTWYTKVEEDGTMSCLWVMPYKKECTVKILNMGDQEVKVIKGDIITAPYNWDGNTMYFGSSWKQFTDLKTGEMKNNEGDGDPFDINYVELKGKGVYAGDGITLFNTVYAWWGEGDEKVYVDNETFPSHIGTGTEDYYGYAWCRPEKFIDHPFISQPDGSGNFDPGYTVNLRFRGLDAIPFRQAIKFDMEMWHWTKAIINFAPVTFWYISPDNVKDNSFDVKDAMEPVVLERKQLISPLLTENKIEAENLNMEEKTDGYFHYGNAVGRGWSNNMQMIWRNAKSESKLHLTFESENEMTADATVVYSKGKEYGKYKISINGRETMINSDDKEFNIANATINNIAVKKGKNDISITLLSSGKKENLVGIDYISFVKK